MIYNSEHFTISLLQQKDALQLNKLLVCNTERFIDHLPTTLEENSTLEGTKNYISRQIKAAKKKKTFVFIINDQLSRDIIGMIVLKNLDWKIMKGEFAYCIGKRFKGKGMMTEAIKQTTIYAIETLGLKSLEILTLKTNASSVNVALKSGFRWKKTLKNEFMTLNGKNEDIELFEFLSTDLQGSQNPTGLKEKFYSYILNLQDTITSKLEDIDGEAKFKEDLWERPEGGGGRTRVIENGQVFEKGGVNISAVHGKLPESMQQYFGVKDADFYACGLSLVLHPKNPMVPTVHANWRYFEMYDQDGTMVDSWFGGGQDLTPYYLFDEDAIHFHQVCKTACDKHQPKFYELYKKKCDEYFWNSHRHEARGVGGLFFDYCKANDDMTMDDWYNFVTEVGNSFLEGYIPIVEKRKDLPYADEQRKWQEIRRGRYVEFNLVHDKGTLFGLKTNGRIESILMSLPPHVQWIYDYHPEKDSEEEKLIRVLKNPIDWIEF